MKMTRREFVAAVLASTALAGCGGGGGATNTQSTSSVQSQSSPSSTPSPVGPGPFDVAIVGAGTAGMAAAQVLLAAGKTVVVLEARSRVGGRTFTDSTLGTPVDIGAGWLVDVTPSGNGLTSNNPFFDLAVAQNVPGLAPDISDRVFFDGSTLLSIENAAEGAAMIQAVQNAVIASGSLTRVDPVGFPDISPLQTCQEIGLVGKPFFKLAAGSLLVEHGGTFATQSCLDIDLYLDTGLPIALPTTDNWLIPGGLGAFVVKNVSQGVPITLNTPVTAIDYGGVGVRLTTPNGTVSARKAIVTCPMGVLASGQPRFSPALPNAHMTAIHTLGMAKVEKVFLKFNQNIFGDLGTNTFATPYADVDNVPVVQCRVYGNNVCLCLFGQDLAEQVQRQGGEQALIQFVLHEVVGKMFPQAPGAFVAGRSSTWITDPYSLGAYSFAPTGAVPLRTALADPVAERLFFAGEAVTLRVHSCVPGAYASGRLAAQKALTALG